MSPSQSSGDPADRPADERAVADTASWVSRMVARSRPSAEPVPGIVAPLRFDVDFAVNSQSDAVSVSLANGAVRVDPWAADATGDLTLTVRWSDGFQLAGVRPGAVVGGWTVSAVAAGRAVLEHPSLVAGEAGADVPSLTLVKSGAPGELDEVTARVKGTSGHCRDSTIRGWSRG